MLKYLGSRGIATITGNKSSRLFAVTQHTSTDRNLLVDNRRLDRLSQTPALNSVAVRLERVEPAVAETVAAPRVAED